MIREICFLLLLSVDGIIIITLTDIQLSLCACWPSHLEASASVTDWGHPLADLYLAKPISHITESSATPQFPRFVNHFPIDYLCNSL